MAMLKLSMHTFDFEDNLSITTHYAHPIYETTLCGLNLDEDIRYPTINIDACVKTRVDCRFCLIIKNYVKTGKV